MNEQGERARCFEAVLETLCLNGLRLTCIKNLFMFLESPALPEEQPGSHRRVPLLGRPLPLWCPRRSPGPGGGGGQQQRRRRRTHRLFQWWWPRGAYPYFISPEQVFHRWVLDFSHRRPCCPQILGCRHYCIVGRRLGLGLLKMIDSFQSSKNLQFANLEFEIVMD